MKRESEYESLMWDRWASEARQLIATLPTIKDVRARIRYTRRLIELTQFLKQVDIAISLQQHLPPSDGYTVGEEAALAAAIHGKPSPQQLAAVVEYTTDGDGGTFSVLNRALRSKNPRTELSKLNELQSKTNRNLSAMFSAKAGLSCPIRLYRGISKKLARYVIERGLYADKGWSSASTSLAVALSYTGDDRCVLVIDLPKGYKAASLAEISAKPHEVEVLLRKNCALPKVGKHQSVKIDGKDESWIFIHVVGRTGK